jgi:hypothetical protein
MHDKCARSATEVPVWYHQDTVTAMMNALKEQTDTTEWELFHQE